MISKIKGYMFPKGLWTRDFTFWWIISLASVFMFDLFWMGQTTFRPMSYFAFYPVLFLIAFFLALPALFDKKGAIQTVWLLFFDMLFIANLMYCRTYYNAIPLASYGLVSNLADFTSSVADSFKWYFIFLPILSLGAFGWYAFRSHPKWKYPSPLLYIGYVVLLGIVIWAGDAWRGGIMKRMDYMSQYAYLSSSVTPIYSLAGFLAHDYYRTSEKITPEARREVVQWLDTQNKLTQDYWADSLRMQRKTPHNLVVILCESLESWVIGTEVEGKVITPNLNRWIEDSTTFYAPNVVTQVGSGRSIEGQLLILSGLMPMRNKVYAYDAIDNDFFTLPKAMKTHGAKAIEFTPDKPYVWNQARVAPAFGFDSLISSGDFKTDETTGRTKRLSDGSLMRQVVEKLQSENFWPENDPFFILIVTNSGHNPFDLPQHLRSISFDGDFPKIIKDYMVTAHYTDSALATIIDYLRERPDWEDTMVVITGDHEGLASDRKDALANPIASKFVDNGQHTPLVILNSPVAGSYLGQFGQVDVYSTVLDLMRLDDYYWRGLGVSIFDPLYPGVAIGSTGDINGDTSKIDTLRLDHVKSAPSISDKILKFDLLKPKAQTRSVL